MDLLHITGLCLSYVPCIFLLVIHQFCLICSIASSILSRAFHKFSRLRARISWLLIFKHLDCRMLSSQAWWKLAPSEICTAWTNEGFCLCSGRDYSSLCSTRNLKIQCSKKASYHHDNSRAILSNTRLSQGSYIMHLIKWALTHASFYHNKLISLYSAKKL